MFTLITSSKFFFVEFAKELDKQNKLHKLVIGYPRFKLSHYKIPKKRIATFPYFHASFMRLQSLISLLPQPIQGYLALFDVKSITLFARISNKNQATFIAMSSMAQELFIKSRHSNYPKVVIFRASRHIVEQDEILKKASEDWDVFIQRPSPRIITREVLEYKLADLIIVPSEICKESFIRNGVDPEKVKVIYFPYTLSSYTNHAKTARDGNRVTFVGNVSARKGIITLLEAWKRLGRTDLSLTIIGRTEGKFMKCLKSKNLLSENVHFSGHMNHHEIQQHLAHTSLFIMPSIEEGWPMALMEAISMQCVTLISDAICKLGELPNPHMNFMFESGNSVQLAQMISELTSCQMQIKLNERRSTVVTNQIRTWKHFVDEFSEVVESLK